MPTSYTLLLDYTIQTAIKTKKYQAPRSCSVFYKAVQLNSIAFIIINLKSIHFKKFNLNIPLDMKSETTRISKQFLPEYFSLDL